MQETQQNRYQQNRYQQNGYQQNEYRQNEYRQNGQVSFMNFICHKVISAIFISLILIFFEIESLAIKMPEDVSEIQTQLKGIKQLHLIRDTRTYESTYRKTWKPISSIPLQSTKQLIVSVNVEFTLGYDLKEARVVESFDDEGYSLINVQLGNFKILSKNVVSNNIKEQSQGYLNAWSIEERNQCLKNTTNTLQKRMIQQITGNYTYLQQIASLTEDGLIPVKSRFKHQIHNTIRYVNNAISKFDNLFDFAKPPPISAQEKTQQKRIQLIQNKQQEDHQEEQWFEDQQVPEVTKVQTEKSSGSWWNIDIGLPKIFESNKTEVQTQESSSSWWNIDIRKIQLPSIFKSRSKQENTNSQQKQNQTNIIQQLQPQQSNQPVKTFIPIVPQQKIIQNEKDLKQQINVNQPKLQQSPIIHQFQKNDIIIQLNKDNTNNNSQQKAKQ